MRQLNEILEEIADGPTIRFAAIVRRDGFVVGSSASSSQEDEMAASRVAQLLFAADGVGEELGHGSTRQILVKYDEGLLVVDSLDTDTALVTALGSEASMAWVKYAVTKYLPEISQRL